ncbi:MULTISPECIES: cupin domain-containing protein [unclassified Shewanella]|uniref:ribosomal protein uL16 3-hydroxylase n=1 Tax=unclassified Shewanella TaxID=196818 RepID=UPI001BC45085|nr:MULTISPECIES: cupin domain-containing protein [unclassified Shewanella]GIU12844.1 cupin [Shewanella sp. MBTL60-112-B1]GIU38212.1 cupin [Shewanella sp. MBTL60-112-B2]
MFSLNFDTSEFLTRYWQQQPILIKNAFPNFEDLLSADELAGLACEESVASRVVVTKPDDWQIIEGPFEGYDQFGNENWQLLVQALNHWHPDSSEFINAFRFIPDWRFDDLMVSFATPGGGVGAHIDNYDVFIIQGEGQRHWTVGDKGQYAPKNNDPTTPLIEGFEPIIDVVLEKGDLLYIPPGFPHQGQTLTLAMSYSIGFRAPSQQELFSEMADALIDANSGLKRFTSSDEPKLASQISTSHQQDMMALITELANDPTSYQVMLGKMLSQNRFELDICEPEEAYTTDDMSDYIAQGAQLYRIGGLKLLKLEDDSISRIFVNGEAIKYPAAIETEVQQLCERFTFDNEQTAMLIQTPATQALILDLLNRGYFYFGE